MDRVRGVLQIHSDVHVAQGRQPSGRRAAEQIGEDDSRAALQRIKGLKHELVFRFPDGRPLAIASFNDHELFFGDAFKISLTDGSPAWSGCVAFGLERWLMAVLVTHGVEPSGWPVTLSLNAELAQARGSDK